MTERKETPGEIGAAAAQMLMDNPLPFPKGLSRWERRALKILTAPDPELDRKIGEAILKIIADRRRRESAKNCTP